MKIGEKIRFHREKAGLRPKELALKTGYSVSLVYKVENGHLKATRAFARSVENQLKCDLNFNQGE